MALSRSCCCGTVPARCAGCTSAERTERWPTRPPLRANDAVRCSPGGAPISAALQIHQRAEASSRHAGMLTQWCVLLRIGRRPAALATSAAAENATLSSASRLAQVMRRYPARCGLVRCAGLERLPALRHSGFCSEAAIHRLRLLLAVGQIGRRAQRGSSSPFVRRTRGSPAARAGY